MERVGLAGNPAKVRPQVRTLWLLHSPSTSLFDACSAQPGVQSEAWQSCEWLLSSWVLQEIFSGIRNSRLLAAIKISVQVLELEWPARAWIPVSKAARRAGLRRGSPEGRFWEGQREPRAGCLTWVPA